MSKLNVPGIDPARIECITDAGRVESGEGEVMKRYWLSWYEPSEDHRPLTFPPGKAILGWWCSGYDEAADILCAVVEAKSEGAAWKAVAKDWPGPTRKRFCDVKDADWKPGDRFPLSEWMAERFAKDGKS